MFRLRPVPGSVPHRLSALRPIRPLPPSTFRSLSNNAGGKIVRPTSSSLSQNFFAGHHRPSSKPHPQLSHIRTRTTFRIPSIPSEEFAGKHPYISVSIRLVLSSILGLTFLTGAILVHDAFTYSERHVDRVPCNPLSLKPRVGGKKNLPIIEVNLDDEEDETKRAMRGKPRLVVVGGGWGVSHFTFMEKV